MSELETTELEIPHAGNYCQQATKRLEKEISEAATDLARQLVNAYTKTDGSLTETYILVPKADITGIAQRYLQNYKMRYEAARILNSKNWSINEHADGFKIEPWSSFPKHRLGLLNAAGYPLKDIN